MTNEYRYATIDFETDPFKHGRFPRAFAVGFYDGNTYLSRWGRESDVIDFAIARIENYDGIVYAHNGGRFDFLGILFKRAGERLHGEPVTCIAGRVVRMRFGQAELRDSYAILPAPLRSYDKGEINYAKLEASCRYRHRREILEYLGRDVRSLHTLVGTFLSLHGTAPLTAASAGMRYMKKLGIQVEKLNETDDKKFRQWYAGGLVLARKPGIHKGNFTVYDIKSAYPYAMVHSHSITRDFDFLQDVRRIQGSDFVHCRGDANDCFIRRSEDGQSNEWGGSGDFRVTGWEYKEAIRAGKFRGRILYCERPKIVGDFKPYVNHFFDAKQQAEASGDKAGRLIAKIMLNSLYGKFAQRPDRYRDYVLMPCDMPVCNEWEEEAVYDECNFSVWSKPAEAYGYYNVATAASITGFVRAMLMKAIYETDCYYCDTDSIIVGKQEAIVGGGALGSWTLETEGDILYIGGKKLYALRIARRVCPNESTAVSKGYQWHEGRAWKIASKGCRLNPAQMKSICEGKSVVYKNDAPSYSLLNSPMFVTRTIRATAKTKTKQEIK